ncbi:MAG: HAMP domain-containing protein [Proteobacteria bacterium]|nr:HAMP domain-containing protein [Pseudomonadota bacterium]
MTAVSKPFRLKELLRRLRFDLAFFHWLKRYLPRGLYGRALLILVLPVILAQAVATFVFYDRHWQTVTNRLAYAVAGEIATTAAHMEEGQPQQAVEKLHDRLVQNLDLDIRYHPETNLSQYPARGDYSTLLATMLRRGLDAKVGRPYVLDLRHAPRSIAVHVLLKNGVLTAIFPERRVYTPTANIFLIWMVGSSALLSLIAILFMRNQIRPIRRLADAADRIGKGLDVPHFKPEGAREVRQAAVNLIIMRDRLRRQITQRTAMLNGVSHDLRTPLTRMKLQLALMRETPEITELKADVQEMTTMVEAYLAFARGEDTEEPMAIDLESLLEEVTSTARRTHEGVPIHFESFESVIMGLRPQAIRRALGNLIGNAARYAKSVWLGVYRGQKFVDILIDDNGPGIPSERREEVFRPFTRLEDSRNPETGGVGLGLTIASDIAHNHGGKILLEDSPRGGLRVVFRLPL